MRLFRIIRFAIALSTIGVVALVLALIFSAVWVSGCLLVAIYNREKPSRRSSQLRPAHW